MFIHLPFPVRPFFLLFFGSVGWQTEYRTLAELYSVFSSFSAILYSLSGMENPVRADLLSERMSPESGKRFRPDLV